MSELFRVRMIVNMAPVTKKNHSRIVYNSKTKVPMVIPSEQYKKYEREFRFCSVTVDGTWPLLPIDFPVNVKCTFYMPTKRKCDLTNLLEAIDDVLVKYKYLEDDNYSIIAGHDGSRVKYDKECPRTEIEITEVCE